MTEDAGAGAGADEGTIVWFTGLPASGKTTLARRVQQQLARTGRASVLLDSDELRDLLGTHAYGPEDRDRFYRSLAGLAHLLARQGIVALVAATAPRREDRDRARGRGGRFLEVWVRTPLAACETRDPKGLYAQARRGEARELPGVGVAYEPPLAPEVVAEGGLDDAAVAEIAARLDRRARPGSGNRSLGRALAKCAGFARLVWRTRILHEVRRNSADCAGTNIATVPEHEPLGTNPGRR